jgi:preprotein translocase subunit SecD
LHLHIEADHSTPDRSQLVNISRHHPVPITVEKAPFLSESYLTKAEVVNDMGGFAIRLQFDRQGTWLLEQYSAANRGKHIAIYSQFVMHPEEHLNSGRWLAAPKISQRITDGSLTFTPDATREEANEIVLGLNNIARQMEKDSKLW